MAEAQENPNVEEQEEEECPKCPPKGAPAWMATFADMATLLMAFFVLILSFAEFNVPKFKQISGSLKNAFGIQRVVPVVEQPRGTTVLALNFSPSPEPSVTKNMTQQSTNTEQKNLDLKSEEDQRESSKSSSKNIEKAKKLEEALKSMKLDKSVTTEIIDDKVVVKINNEESKDVKDVVSKTITAIENARNKSGNYDTDVLIGGINNEIKAIAMASQNNKALIDKINEINKEEQEEKRKTEEIKIKAKSAEDEFKVALKQEIGQGLTDVKREKDRVIITVGSAGAFRSGSALLTENAKKIMKKIAKVSEKGTGQINVSGHTDNVPLIFGGQYRDNWDLAAARASSVVQSISKSGDIPLDRLMAISYGESKPLASNDNANGRSKNRRIEIEIKY
ncbi:OmpA family protein [Alphaproteobacteria bacterium]|nr:OmpA family protein [Alphaproteobacteria bacterium]